PKHAAKVETASEPKKGKEEEPIISKKVTEDEVKKENKLLLILGSIFTGIVVLVTAICVILPRVTDVDNVKVPETSGMEELKAEELLIEEGLRVNSELKKIPSDTIEEGKVVKTDPASGRTVKEGTEVTIYVSSGANALTLEDYTNRNYIEVKAILESTYNISVKVETKEVDNPSDYKASMIIGQSPSAGEKVLEGGTLILYIPNVEDVYPDFTTGDFSLAEIQDFAKKYNLQLNIKQLPTDEFPAGTILGQSRQPNSRIASGASFTITIAQEPLNEGEIPEGEGE
ncbi:MAG TPA: hypothetical protein DCY94_02625, partial [Firmicutes bacterium]|nr:hypothetical protein [Bacillota bacterium]